MISGVWCGILSLHSAFAEVARLFTSNGGTQATREAADPVIHACIHQLMKHRHCTHSPEGMVFNLLPTCLDAEVPANSSHF
jgi:hypothetical protein